MVRLKVAFGLLVNSGRDNSRKKDEGLARRDRSVCEMKDIKSQFYLQHIETLPKYGQKTLDVRRST